MLLYKCGLVRRNAQVFEPLAWPMLRDIKPSPCGNLKLIVKHFRLVIVNTHTFPEHALVSVVRKPFRFIFYTLQQEVHAVVECHGVVRILLEVDCIQSLVLPIVVVYLLQIVLIS